MKFKILFILLILPVSIFAEVYKWTDEQGKVHYSTKKTDPQAKVAELPEITKGEVVIPADQTVTCFKHGGVNCQAGADTDGSVICQDGEKNSIERFLFSCKESKIILENIGEISSEGDFPIYIRNKSGVTAKKVTVEYKATEEHTAKLSGPNEIPAFALAEYKLPGIYFIDGQSTPNRKAIKFTCENCP